MRGADLTGANLTRLDLRHADLSGSVLVGSQIYGSRLDGIDLSHADLRFAQLAYTSMRGAVLRNAQLGRASFRGADLQDADLRGAAMRDTDFIAANVRRAQIDVGVDVDRQALGFGQPTRRLTVSWRDPSPQPVTRGPLTEIPDLEDIGISGFDGIPDIIALAIEPETQNDEFMAVAAIMNLGPRLLVAGGLSTLLDAVRDGRGCRAAVELIAMCGNEARPALAPLIVMLRDGDAAACRRAIHALGEIGLAEPEVLAALEGVQHHPDESIRETTRQALIAVRRGPKNWDDD